MSVTFPSEEWAQAYMDAINADAGYAQAGKDWTHGAVAMVVEAEPENGVPETVALVLDLHEGVCRSATVTDAEGASRSPFVITGGYTRWKAVTKGELDPIKAMMQGKLKLKGNLPTIVRNVKASQALIAVSAGLDTDYPDEG